MNELSDIVDIKPDAQLIYDMIPQGSRVLDLGSGDGTLLKLLRDNKQCKIQGIDLDQHQVIKCISNGVPVIQMNLDEGLAYFPDQSFDYVILGLTFQQIEKPHILLKEMCRVGKRSIVSVFNLGFIKTRLQLFFKGAMPNSKRLPYEWYNTPNIHLGTQRDFHSMCEIEKFKIYSTNYISSFPAALVKISPNTLSEICIFTIHR